MSNDTTPTQLSLFDVEQWRPVVGYEGVYAVSNHGRVMRTSIHDKRKIGILKPRPNSKGYLRVSLWVNNKGVFHFVHRLVMAAFKGDPNGLVVNHIDSNYLNNHLSNLEYCTQAQNMQHMVKQGRRIYLNGEGGFNVKLTWDKVNEIRSLYATGKYTLRALGLMFNVDPTNIGSIVHRETWK